MFGFCVPCESLGSGSRVLARTRTRVFRGVFQAVKECREAVSVMLEMQRCGPRVKKGVSTVLGCSPLLVLKGNPNDTMRVTYL